MALIDMILGTDPEERKNRYQEGGQAVGANIVPPEVSRPPITEQASPERLPDQQLAIPAEPVTGSEMMAMLGESRGGMGYGETAPTPQPAISGSEMMAMLGEGKMDLTPSEAAPTPSPAAPLQDQYAEVDALFAPSVLMDEQKQAHQLVDPDQMQAFIDKYGVDEAKKMLSAGMKTWQSKNIVETGDEGIIDRFTSGLTNLFGDESRMTRLALAFNSMRLNPDQGLAAVLGKRLETLDKQRLSRTKAPMYAKKLTKMGYPDYAEIVLANPDQAEEIFKQVIQKQLEKKSSVKTSGVQTDEATGRRYVVISDAEGNQEIKYLDDVKGLTTAQELEIKNKAEAQANDIKMAQDEAKDMMGIVKNIDSSIGNFEDAQRALEKGAYTGKLANWFPTFRDATIELQNAVNRLGLNVIAGTTFGALSEAELRMALDTAVPTDLSGPALKEWIDERMDKKRKLKAEILRQARKLSGGMKYSEWVAETERLAEEAAKARELAKQSGQSTAPAATALAKPTPDQQAAAQAELRRRGLIK